MRHITVEDRGIISDGLLYQASQGRINLMKLLTDADYFRECVDIYVEAWNHAADVING